MRKRWLLVAALNAAMLGCRNALGVPVPAGVIDPSGLGGAAGAEVQRQGAITALANALDVEYSGLLSDEFTTYFLQADPNYPGFSTVDARDDEASGVSLGPVGSGAYATDFIYANLQQARANAHLAAAALARSAPVGSVGEVGAMFALTGYSELLLAEAF